VTFRQILHPIDLQNELQDQGMLNPVLCGGPGGNPEHANPSSILQQVLEHD